MTANRWWVRAGARWIARIDSVKGHLSLVFQGMTGVSIASGALKYFGHSNLVAPFIALTAAGLLAYAYLYSEGGVWNQVSRDRMDLSDNYAGPGMAISTLVDSAALAATARCIAEGETDPETVQQQVDEAVQQRLAEYRDGIDLSEVYNGDIGEVET